jgi:sigma-B regulation protein RsbU (phosphoserine phosphatase)
MAMLLLLPILVVWAAVFAWLSVKAERALGGNARAVAASVRTTMEDALAFGQPLAELRGAAPHLQFLLRENPTLMVIAVVDLTRQPLFVEGEAKEGLAALLERGERGNAVATLPLRVGGAEVGSILVAARPLDWMKALHDEGQPLLVLPAVCLLLAAVAVRVGFRRICVEPLDRVLTQFDAGANGDFEAAQPSHRQDEIGRMARVLLVLSRLIRERASQFSDYADEVHRVVADPAVAIEVEALRLTAGATLGESLFGRHTSADAGGEPTSRPKGPLLRGRITLLVFFAVIMVSLGMAFSTSYRVSMLEDAASSSAVAAVDLTWRKVTEAAVIALQEEAAPLAMDPALIDSVATKDSAALGVALEATRVRFSGAKVSTDIEIAAADGGLLYGGGSADGSSLLGSFTITTVVRTAEPVSGLAINPDHELVIVFARPIVSGDRVVGSITLVRDAVPLLHELAAILGAVTFALDLDGRLLHGDSAKLWAKIGDKVDLGRRGLGQVWASDSIYSTASMGLPTIGKGRLGHLVAVHDVTERQIRSNRLQLAFHGLVAVMMATAVWLIYYYLGHVFAPLDAAIAALNTLSRGDTAVILDTPATDDEVGRIAAAVRVFRDRTRALLWVNEERTRRRRRQERLIRRQMLKLAETLQDGAREAVLKDLDRIEQEASLRSSGTEVAAELDALAIAFQTMAGRVREQHRELDMLVAELREALKAKTAFIAIQQELEIARELQLAILPKVSTDAEEFEAHAIMTPAKEVGGDFYDFFQLSPRKVGMVVADVSGKGVPASLFMAVSRTLLKATAMFKMSPGECLRKLNDLLVEGNEKSLFVTVFYGILDLDTGVLTYANGGHNSPIMMSRDGSVTPLEGTGGIVLALEPGLPYEERTQTMNPGDTLVMFTDGVTEAMNLDSVMFGDSLLAEKLQQCAGLSAHETTGHLIAAVHEFSAGCPQTDDITCFAFRYKGPAPMVGTQVFTLRNDLGELPRLRRRIESFLDQYDLPIETIFNICLSLDEIFTNIVSYGYEDQSERQIEVAIQHDGKAVVATVVDDGKEYDPLADPPEIDLDAELETRAVGGLGIFLVRTFMDQVSYCRDAERNRLVIVKRVTGVADEGNV